MTEHSVVTRIKLDGGDAEKTLSRIASGANTLDSSMDNAKNSTMRFRDGLVLGAVAGVASAAVSKIASSIKAMSGDAMEASDALAGYNYAMGFIGIDKAKIESSKQVLKDYALQTTYNLRDVMTTAQVVASSGEKDFDVITKALGNVVAMGDGAEQEFKHVSDALGKINTNGKLTAGTWMFFKSSIPASANLLQKKMKEMGLYTGSFASAMSKGKISAKDFNRALVELGDNKFAEEYAKGTSFYSGSMNRLKNSVINAWLNIEETIGKTNITGMINKVADGIIVAGDKIEDSINFIKDNGDWIKPLAIGAGGGLLLHEVLAKSAKQISKLQKFSSIKTSIDGTTTAYARASIAQARFMKGSSATPIIAKQKAIQASVKQTSAIYALSNANLQSKLAGANGALKMDLGTNSVRSNMHTQIALFKQQEQAVKETANRNIANWTPTIAPIANTTTKLTMMQRATTIASTGIRGLNSAMNFLAGPYGLLLTLGAGLLYSFYKQKTQISDTEKQYQELGKTIGETTKISDTKLGKIGQSMHDSMVSGKEKVDIELAKLQMSFNKNMDMKGLKGAVNSAVDTAVKKLGELKKEVGNITSENSLGLSSKDFSSFALAGKDFEKQMNKDIKAIEKYKKNTDEAFEKAAKSKKGSKAWNQAMKEIETNYSKIVKKQIKYDKLASNSQIESFKQQAKNGKLGAKTLKEANKLIIDEYSKQQTKLEKKHGETIAAAKLMGREDMIPALDKAFDKQKITNLKSQFKDVMGIYDVDKSKLGGLAIVDGKISKFADTFNESSGKMERSALKADKNTQAFLDTVNGSIKDLNKTDKKAVLNLLDEMFSGEVTENKSKESVNKESNELKNELDAQLSMLDELKGSIKKGFSVDDGEVFFEGQKLTKLFTDGTIAGLDMNKLQTGVKYLTDNGFTVENEGITYNGKNVSLAYINAMKQGMSNSDFKTFVKSAIKNGFEINGEEVSYKGKNVTDFFMRGLKQNLSGSQLKSQVDSLISNGFNFEGGNLMYQGQNVTAMYMSGLKSGMKPAEIQTRIQSAVDAGFTVDGTKIMLNGQNVTKEYEKGLDAGLSPEQIKAKIEKKIPNTVTKKTKTNVKPDVKVEGGSSKGVDKQIKDKLPNTVTKKVNVTVTPQVKVGNIGAVGKQIQGKIPAMVTKTVRVNLNATSNASGAGNKVANQFVQAIVKSAGKAQGAGSKLASSAKGGLNAGASGSSGIGINFGSGFVGGINSQVGAAYSAGLALGNAAKKGAKDAGDVRSPSREMKKIARFYVQGMLIEFNQSVKKLESIGNKLGKAVITGTKKGLRDYQEQKIISTNYEKLLGQQMTQKLKGVTDPETRKEIMAYYKDLIDNHKRESKYAYDKMKLQTKNDIANAKLEKKKEEAKKDRDEARAKLKSGKKTIKVNGKKKEVKLTTKEKSNLKKKISNENKEINRLTKKINANNSNTAIKIGNIENKEKIYNQGKEFNEWMAEQEKERAEKMAEEQAKATQKALEDRGLISPTLSTGEAKIINITQPIQIHNSFQEVRNFDQFLKQVESSFESMMDAYFDKYR